MSHRKVPFQFDDSDPLDKTAWKRFGLRPEDERRMFFETSPINSSWPDWQSKFHRPYYDDPEWRGRPVFSQCGSDPDSPSLQRRMRGWNSSSEEGSVPIKVVHERTPPRSNDDGTDSETSSQASHGSQGSSSSQPQKAKITREPRVHHIPIMVEPREGSTSSGYASDGATEASAMNHDTEHQVQHTEARMPSGQTQKHDGARINSVPIRLNGGMRADSPSRIPSNVYGHHTEPFAAGNAKFGSSGPNAFQPTAPPRQRSRASSQPPSSPQATTSGPHITRIPMNMDTSEPKTPVPEQEEKPEKKVKTGCDPMITISDILKEVLDLGKAVEALSGIVQEKQYRYLDEMLTRCMLKLDNIETEGRDDIRQSRKAAIREVHKCINQLEAKIHPSVSNVSAENSNMETETNAEESTSDICTTNEVTDLQGSASEQTTAIPVSENMDTMDGVEREDVAKAEKTDSSEVTSCQQENDVCQPVDNAVEQQIDQSDRVESQTNSSGQ